ncbi:MAG TPA: GyrI-like domain-containing protein [Anaerolineales bacterium]|nr:GyrI-like domain-containing protein [Anaerolineales bacterium]
MSKVDFKKELSEFYSPPAKFVIVDIPEMRFLMIEGHGDPNVAQEYQDAVGALYALAYKIKFMSKNQLGKDYVVPPLEGLWWAEDMEAFTTARDKSQWDWNMMITTPEWITSEMFVEALELVRKGKNPVAMDKVRLESYHEGLSVQIMHIGSYDSEGPTLMKLHREFIPNNGYVEKGKHHEIYLGDPRRVAPEKLKTVLRQPVRKV